MVPRNIGDGNLQLYSPRAAVDNAETHYYRNSTLNSGVTAVTVVEFMN